MRSLRIVLLSLSMTLVLLALAAVSARGVRAQTQEFVFTTVPRFPCANDSVDAVVHLMVCPPCAHLVSATRDSLGLLITYEIVDPDTCNVPVPCAGDSASIRLWHLDAGSQSIFWRVTAIRVHPGDRRDTVLTRGSLPIFVAANCVAHPPVLAVLDSVAFGTPICAGRSFGAQLIGHFPTTCGRLEGVSLVPGPTADVPPTVRLTFKDTDCLSGRCYLTPQPWSTGISLPALPAGATQLNIELARQACADSTVLSVDHSAVPFTVRACSTVVAPPCLFSTWGPIARETVCNATLAPGGTADVEMHVLSSVALAGLQGALGTDSSLVIRGLAPIGAAAGMTLQWVPTPGGGARFVMFATQGAPIPNFPPPDSSYTIPAVLRVTVAQAPGHDVAPVARVFADTLFGADSLARFVGRCPYYTFGWANVCRGSTCDVNGDGVADVRDLVLMVHCILGNGPCADTTAGRHDCNGDGRANLDDVLCCARAILRGTVRDSVPGRSEPAVALQFGEAVRTANGVTLPLTLEGADRVGAARLALKFPADRYELDGLTGAGSDWLALSEVQGDQVVVGLIAVGTPAPGSSVPLELGLRLKAGAEHGGEVAVASAEVSAPDGASLATNLVGSGASIAGVSAVTLAVRPNPFDASGTTLRFTLPRAAQVELAVYDVAGRRVATVVSGALAAGAYTRRWEAGGAHSGVYFVRLRADGVELAHKAVLRRGR